MSAPIDGTLAERTRALLCDAALALAGTPAGDVVATAIERFDEPVRVALAGRVKAGKSTILNALLGESLAPTDASECTTLVTWYRFGDSPKVLAHLSRGRAAVELPFRRASGPIDVDLSVVDSEIVDHLEVQWPLRALRDLILVDTPGLDSLTAATSARTMTTLASADDEPGVGVADVVIYLLRHAHGADVRFLEAFRSGHPLGLSSPLHCIGVLGRADEVGVARPDAMSQAMRVAERYATDTRLRRLCHTVVPVAGLVAEAANGITHEDFVAVKALAAVSASVPDLLLDVDTFTLQTDPAPGGVPADVRRDLVRRLGLYGVRTSIAMVHDGRAPTSLALARALRVVSGFHELDGLLRDRLTLRSDLLKVRAALSALGVVLTPGRPGVPAGLLDQFEALTATAHELREARLLEGLRSSEIDLEEDDVVRAERLLGAGTVRSRLALSEVADVDEVRRAAEAEVAHWRRTAESPFLGSLGAEAARVLVRSAEGLAADTDR